jgi:ring-1,2-phenylacetyl-CoA epoxidase subunit PaaC
VSGALLAHVLRRADDGLILGHRLSEWSGRAPSLEEDMALSNMGLDLIGQARALYGYAGDIEGAGRGEDDFAYFRDDRHFGNLLICERPNGDFAVTMVRQFFYAAFAEAYWRAGCGGADATLAAIAARSEKEMAYHRRHAAEWVIRLGDGTEESHRRAQAAVDGLWAYTGEFFAVDATEAEVIASGAAPDPSALRDAWLVDMRAVLAEATLTAPAEGGMQMGGRAGRHTEHLGPLLAEMQHLARSHPGATW